MISKWLPPGTILVQVLLLACEPSDRAVLATYQVDTLPSPAATGSGEPNLTTGPEGQVYLSWLERTGDSTHALRFSVLEGNGWTTPRTIAERGDFFVNWADFPSIIALSQRSLAAHWLQRSGTTKYAYDVRIAQSHDGGHTWTDPIVPHRDGTPTEHGFVSLFPFRDSLGAIWLDGRNFASVAHGGAANMQLLMTSISTTGRPGVERILDERVCDCCQTSLAVTASGPVVVYRDRSEGEIRDISVARWRDTTWSEGTVVHADDWKIDACPVNGPAIAAAGDHVAVAWFTAARDSARVYVAQSHDGGASFGGRTRVDDGNPIGRVDVEIDSDGAAVVSWMEFAGTEQADVRVRRIDGAGVRGPATIVARTSGARASGFPRMTMTGSDLVLAWTEAGTPSRIRVARARMGSR
jgi:hypothetical protein